MGDFLSMLCCPSDKGELAKAESSLKCKICGVDYRISNGIVRFVSMDNYAASFGMEWNIFNKTQVDSFNTVGQSVMRVENGMGWREHDVKGKSVLDVGCGSGRFSEIMARWGASVTALDYSSAVEVAKRNLEELNLRCDYVQGDALCLPFKDFSFDCVFSIGVLQHTANPLLGLKEMCRVLKPGGLIGLHGIYLKSIKKSIHPKYIFRPITTKIPSKSLFKIVKAWVNFALPVSRFLRKRLKLRQGLVERLTGVANYEGAPGIDENNVREWALLDTFDWFSPRYDNPLKEKEVEEALRQNNIGNVIHVEIPGINYKGTKVI